jgi:hypothetical protein
MATNLYETQLTTRGLSNGNRTARGSNHFLGRGGDGGQKYGINMPPALRSSRRNTARRRMRKSSSTPAVASGRQRAKQKLEDDAVWRAQMRALKRRSARSDAPPLTAHLTEEHFRSEDLKLNQSIIKRLRKKSQGVGSRLLAPNVPTKKEQETHVHRMKSLRGQLLKQLEETNDTLTVAMTELDQKKKIAEEKEQREKQLRARSRSKNATLNDLEAMNAIKESFENAATVPIENKNNSGTARTSGTARSRRSSVDEKIDYRQSTAKFPPYVGEAYEPDWMKSSYKAYNDQEFGEPPEWDKKDKVRLVAGQIYNENEAPEGLNDDPETTIYFPFKGHDPNEKKVRRSRSTAKCLLLPQGGYGTMIIDKKSRRRGQQIPRPSRWLDGGRKHHPFINGEGQLDDIEEKELLKRMVRTQTRGGGRSSTNSGWKPVTGGKCVARFAGDKEWYLAKIEKIHSRHLEVKFCSRGNNKREIVSKKFVRPVVYDRPLTAGFEGL